MSAMTVAPSSATSVVDPGATSERYVCSRSAVYVCHPSAANSAMAPSRCSRVNAVSSGSVPCNACSWAPPGCISFHDLETKVCCARSVDRPGSFELDLLAAQLLEESDALTEQHRHQVDLQLVE